MTQYRFCHCFLTLKKWEKKIIIRKYIDIISNSHIGKKWWIKKKLKSVLNGKICQLEMTNWIINVRTLQIAFVKHLTLIRQRSYHLVGHVSCSFVCCSYLLRHSRLRPNMEKKNQFVNLLTSSTAWRVKMSHIDNFLKRETGKPVDFTKKRVWGRLGKY